MSVERRLALVHQARVAAGRARVEATARGDQPPQPGDVFVVPGAEGWIEWVLLQRDAEDPRRVLAVPADANPLAGREDVPVPTDAACGPLTMRCALAAWIDIERFPPERRTGVVEPAYLEAALSRWKGMRAGNPPSVQIDPDLDPEYREWMDELRQQVRTTLSGVAADPEPRRPGWAQRLLGPRPLVPASLAAAAIVLGLASWQESRQAAALRTARDTSERAHAEERVAWERERRELERTVRQAPATGSAGRPVSPPAMALGNLPFVWLAPQTAVRGEPERLAVRGSTSWVVLILSLEQPGRHPAYRLDITEEAGGTVAVRIAGLTPTGTAELSVAVPGSALPVGGYRLRVYGASDSAPVHEYRLQVVAATANRP